jgi:LysM repeat protein
MKRIFFSLLVLPLGLASTMRAQDAATEERLNRLSGQIEDLIAAQKAQQRQIAELLKEVQTVREQASKPSAVYASPDDLKHLADTVKEIDQKRIDDYKKITADLLAIRKAVETPAPSRKSPPAISDHSSDKEKPSEKGYEYVVQTGDTLSVIVQAYREKNIKITVDQILKANPGLSANKMRVGQKLFIPAPQT